MFYQRTNCIPAPEAVPPSVRVQRVLSPVRGVPHGVVSVPHFPARQRGTAG